MRPFIVSNFSIFANSVISDTVYILRLYRLFIYQAYKPVCQGCEYPVATQALRAAAMSIWQWMPYVAIKYTNSVLLVSKHLLRL